MSEELAYRGFLLKVLGNLFGNSLTGVLLIVVISSMLVSQAYNKQGIIGVVVTTIDAVVFSWLKLRFDNNLWAAIQARGFYISISVMSFYFIGPILG